MQCDEFNKLFNYLNNMVNIEPKKNNTTNKAIGILKLTDNNITNVISVNNLIGSDINLSKLYLFGINEQFNDLTFKKLIQLYSNFIECIYVTDTLVKMQIDIINKYLDYDIYVFNVDTSYVTLKIPNNSDIVYNLSYTDNRLLTYNNSAFSYKIHDGSSYYLETVYKDIPDVKIPLMSDFLIPRNTFNKKIKFLKNIELNIIIYLHVIKDKKLIGYISKDNITKRMFNYDDFDRQVYTILNKYEEYRIPWYRIFSYYTKNFSNVDFYNNNIDLVFLNSANAELTVENINNYNRIFYLPTKTLSILDNVDITVPENNIVKQLYRLNNIDQFNILYNNVNQLFIKEPNMKGNSHYGMARFGQTIQYLIDHSKSDILVVIGDKIIMTNPIYFDPKNVWGGYTLNNENCYGYVNIFNIKLMKEYNIKYYTFNQFINDIMTSNLQYELLSPERFGLSLPMDFDKFNGSIFRVAGTKRQIIFNYYMKNYNYTFKTYENYDCYN